VQRDVRERRAKQRQLARMTRPSGEPSPAYSAADADRVPTRVGGAMTASSWNGSRAPWCRRRSGEEVTRRLQRDALRRTLVNAIAAAQACDPTQSTPSCAGRYVDTCGCEAPVSISRPNGAAADCAFQAWSDARCPIVDCGKTCVTPTRTALCVPRSPGTGTCTWSAAKP
jgi:hypothetical protein